MGLDVFLQVLGPLESLRTGSAFVRLQRHMDTKVRGDVVTFDRGHVAGTPLASEVEVVGALTTNMPLAEMILNPEILADSQASENKVSGLT